ncbi:nuclear transport factor 2 family protein [uncultured Neptuniibacter sp.]|uniref:nuclear transport factor 2 family protein n=1 Tax=uncultured Neptuniibacter sp. TaxID=502143 RepID=UPI0026387491|nr:nuclear transport factor 2 family protein [uncultured Neptuniibacter sp.]
MDNWLENYVAGLEALNLDSLDVIEPLLAKEMFFKDPFNETHSRAQFLMLMRHTFERLSDVRFEVHQQIYQEREGFIYWTFHGESKMTGSFSFRGTSRISANEKGLITYHEDFWDASVLMTCLPLVGGLIRQIRKKFVITVT